MRPITGPVQTGTYMIELVEDPGKYTTVNSDKSKFAVTKNSRNDAAKVRVFKIFVKYNLTCIISGSSRVWATTYIELCRKIRI